MCLICHIHATFKELFKPHARRGGKCHHINHNFNSFIPITSSSFPKSSSQDMCIKYASAKIINLNVIL